VDFGFHTVIFAFAPIGPTPAQAFPEPCFRSDGRRCFYSLTAKSFGEGYKESVEEILAPADHGVDAYSAELRLWGFAGEGGCP
jgi:hypothetical protein